MMYYNARVGEIVKNVCEREREKERKYPTNIGLQYHFFLKLDIFNFNFFTLKS